MVSTEASADSDLFSHLAACCEARDQVSFRSEAASSLQVIKKSSHFLSKPFRSLSQITNSKL